MQSAAPSAQQPGGGTQLTQSGLTPQQQQLMSSFNVFIAQGKQLCSQIEAMGPAFEEEANLCDSHLNRLTKIKIKLQAAFEEAVQNAQLVAMASPGGQTPSSTQGMMYQ